MPDPADTRTDAPRPRTWRTAVLTGMASYLDGAALTASGTAVSVLYAPSFHLTPATIGLVLGTQQLSFAVGALTGGRLGDRFGRRRVLTLALLVFVLGTVVLASASSTAMLFPGVVLAGLGIGADLPVALSMANEAAARRRKGRVVVLSQVLWNLGIFSTLTAVSFVGHLGAPGARILFVGLGVVAVLVLVARTVLPESPEWLAARTELAASRRDDPSGPDVRLNRLGEVFRRPVLWAVLATGLYLVMWGVGAGINGKYGGYIWTTLAGGDIERFARLASFVLPFSLLAGLLFMALVDTRWRRPVTAVGTVLILVGWAPLAFAGASTTTMLFVIFAFGIGSCLAGEPLYKVWAQEYVPTLLRGTSQGVTIGVNRVVNAVLAVVVPTLLASAPRVVFVGVFVCALVSAVVWLVWVPRLSRAETIETPAAVPAAPAAAGR